jgi:ProP effector
MTMSKTARRARIAAIIELLCDRYPQTFSRRGPQPLKIGVYADVLAALSDAVQPRDLQSALRAYTSNAGYLRALSAGACRVGLDGNAAAMVTPEDEAVAKARLAELVKGTAPGAKVPSAKAGFPPRKARNRPRLEGCRWPTCERLAVGAGRLRRSMALLATV